MLSVWVYVDKSVDPFHFYSFYSLDAKTFIIKSFSFVKLFINKDGHCSIYLR